MWLAALVSRSMILMRIPSGVCSTTESSWPFSATDFRLSARSPRPSVSVSTSRCSITKFAGAEPKSARRRELQPSNSLSARVKRW
jgi:hypothetical protein